MDLIGPFSPVENNAILSFGQWWFIRLEFCIDLWFIFSHRFFLKYGLLQRYTMFLIPVLVETADMSSFFAFFGVPRVSGPTELSISSSSISELSLFASSFRILDRDLDLDLEAGLRLSTLSAGLWMKFPLLDVLRPGVWFVFWSALDDETLIGLHFKKYVAFSSFSILICLRVSKRFLTGESLENRSNTLKTGSKFQSVTLNMRHDNNWTGLKVESMLGF